MSQACDDRLAEVIERERARQRRVVIDLLNVVSRAADADDRQVRLNPAELAQEYLPRLPESGTGNQDVDAHSPHDFNRFEGILGAQDTVAGLA